MKVKVLIFIISSSLMIISVCCTEFQKGLVKREKEEVTEEGSGILTGEQAKKTQEYLDTTDMRALLMPVIKLSFFHLSFDYFEQFFWDEESVFPEYLFYAFGRSHDGFDEGTGTIVVEKNRAGDIEYVLERALLKVNSDASKWWQVHQTTKYSSVFYEVLISPEGIPLKVRGSHPETGQNAEAVPPLAKQYMNPKRRDKLLQQLEERKNAEIDQEWSFLFHSPQIIGEERIEVEAGSVESIHIADELPNEELKIGYWISPHVPGNMVRIVYRTLEGITEYSMEIVQIRKGYKPQF